MRIAASALALLLGAAVIVCAAGAALAQTPASVPASPEPSMSATPVVAPQPAGALVATPRPATSGGAASSLPPSNGPTITITQVDNGRTFDVSLNQQVVLQLGATLDWSVSYQPDGILRAVPGVNTLTRGTQAILYAAAPGTVTITAQGKPICTAGQACPQFIAQFQATVVVSGTSAQQPSGPVASPPRSGNANPPVGPIKLPNTGGQDNSAPWPALLAGALALALGGAITWRRATKVSRN